VKRFTHYAAFVSSLDSKLADPMSLGIVSRNRNGFLRLWNLHVISCT
jgi:hypothetical protein